MWRQRYNYAATDLLRYYEKPVYSHMERVDEDIMNSRAAEKTFMPLYSQLAELLQRKLDANEYPPGSRMPTENELAEEHGVSVITVRGALKVLIENGRVERFAGKGTFVLQKDPVRAAWGFGSIAEIDMTSEQSEMETLDTGSITAPRWVLQAFGETTAVQLPWMRNVRSVDGERFMVSDIYHRREFAVLVRGARFRKLVQERKLVVMALCELTGVALGEVRQSMSATVATSSIADALRIEVGQVLLVVERLFLGTDGRMLQVGQTHYRVDHYRYELNLRPIQEPRPMNSGARRRLLGAS